MKPSTVSIAEAMRGMEQNKYLLPAIQREFVWGMDQIVNLFDSLLRGYPIGTFLFWQIDADNANNYRFYEFLRRYHERDNNRCILPHVKPKGFTAVLDGQQRLTALYIGLKGSYAQKNKYGRWEDDEAFPEKLLYLNLLSDPQSNDNGSYGLSFKSRDESKQNIDGIWFRCGDVCENGWNIDEYLDDEFEDLWEVYVNNFHIKDDAQKQLKLRAKKNLRRLDRIVNKEEGLTYFEENSEDLDRVLNIFIRLNAGGTKLTYSDLLLSIAIAQWHSLDAREEINNLVGALWSKYQFDLSKDFILKACMMLSDLGSLKFNVDNFQRKNTEKLESNWEKAKKYITLAVEFVHSFGYTTNTISAVNVLLPVAYYLMRTGVGDDYLDGKRFIKDRQILLWWINRSLLKQGIWAGGSDSFLVKLRNVIRNKTELGEVGFPIEAIENVMTRNGRSLKFQKEEIDELLELGYGKPRTFTLLSILMPGSGIQGRSQHVDHIYPQSLFRNKNKLKAYGYSDELIAWSQDGKNRLPNLQLLPATVNRDKSDDMPLTWLKSVYLPEDGKTFVREQFLEDVSDDPLSFESFYKNRKNKLRRVIIKKLGILTA